MLFIVFPRSNIISSNIPRSISACFKCAVQYIGVQYWNCVTIASIQFENVAVSPSQVSESPLPPLKSVSVNVPFRNRAQKHSPTTCALPHWTSLPQDHDGGPSAEGALSETTLECLPPLGGGGRHPALQRKAGLHPYLSSALGWIPA